MYSPVRDRASMLIAAVVARHWSRAWLDLEARPGVPAIASRGERAGATPFTFIHQALAGTRDPGALGVSEGRDAELIRRIARRYERTVIVELTIPGPPVPKGRAKKGKDERWYTPTATRNAEKAIQQELMLRRVRQVRTDVAMTFRFYVGDYRRRDTDNLEKLVMDACKPIVYRDDDQVVEKHTSLVRGHPRPRTEVRIEEVAWAI